MGLGVNSVLVLAIAVVVVLAIVFALLRGGLPNEESKKEPVKVLGVVGAVIAAVPAIPITFIGVVFSHGDDPHPVMDSLLCIVLGVVLVTGGALCGMILGAAIARRKREPHNE